MSISKSISAKIIVPVAIMAILLVGVTATVNTLTFSRYASATSSEKISSIAQGVEKDLAMKQMMALDKTDGIARSAAMIAALKASKCECEKACEQVCETAHKKVRDIIVNFQSERDSAFFTILDADAHVVFRTNRPEQYRDSQSHLGTVAEVLRTQKSCILFESTPNAPLSIRAAAPVFDDNNQFIGIVTGGYRLDTNEWVDTVQREFGVHCTVFFGDKRVATTIRKQNGDSDERAVGTTLDNQEIYDRVFREKAEFADAAMVRGQWMKVSYRPIVGDENTGVVGILFVGLPLDEQTNAIWKKIYSSASVAGIGLLFFVVILYRTAMGIVKPLQIGGGILRDISEKGCLSNDVPADMMRRQDEIGLLCRCVDQVLADYRAVADLTEELAEGNWQMMVNEKSPDDMLNRSIVKMMDEVNDALYQINDSVFQVTTGADEVSHASQSLADGAQKAAASLEEIAAAMHEISAQTKKNAENASQARDLALQTNQAATGGQEAMKEMVVAMEHITQNSSEIQQVIKVIDSIAFQTNMLALNAAVEAARAGQHGKGFAVVADEVRKLAARSSQAAKETSELVTNSGKEIDKGNEIASRTAEALNTIVEQVQKTTDLVADIAAASNEQAQGVGQVTIGLQQVDAVTQQNAASAEETANAAGEMSSLATMLQNLVAKFKLRQLSEIGEFSAEASGVRSKRKKSSESTKSRSVSSVSRL